MAHRINRILGRFGELKSEVQQAALRDARFRALCEDYETAAEALEFWTSSTDPRRPQMIREYRDLMTELETEIFGLVRGGGSPGTGQ
jgi:hypothetical protein